MKLHTYEKEILAIAKANGMSFDIAVHMFLANVANHGDETLPYYIGADEVDYATLKPHHAELKDQVPAWVEDFRKEREIG